MLYLAFFLYVWFWQLCSAIFVSINVYHMRYQCQKVVFGYGRGPAFNVLRGCVLGSVQGLWKRRRYVFSVITTFSYVIVVYFISTSLS